MAASSATTSKAKPVVGQVYRLRVSLIDVYGVDVSQKTNTSSKSSASTFSSTGSNDSGDYRKKPRPGLVWNMKNEDITVLVCGTFIGQDLPDLNILPEVTKARLNSTTVLIKGQEPTEVTPCFRSNNMNTFKDGTYMVLIEHIIKQSKHDWTKTNGLQFNTDQMLHINDLLMNLRYEEVRLKGEEVRLKGEENATRIKQLNLTKPAITNSDENDEQEEDNKSQTGSSIEIVRFHGDEYIDKKMFITRWLNDDKTDDGDRHGDLSSKYLRDQQSIESSKYHGSLDDETLFGVFHETTSIADTNSVGENPQPDIHINHIDFQKSH